MHINKSWKFWNKRRWVVPFRPVQCRFTDLILNNSLIIIYFYWMSKVTLIARRIFWYRYTYINKNFSFSIYAGKQQYADYAQWQCTSPSDSASTVAISAYSRHFGWHRCQSKFGKFGSCAAQQCKTPSVLQPIFGTIVAPVFQLLVIIFLCLLNFVLIVVYDLLGKRFADWAAYKRMGFSIWRYLSASRWKFVLYSQVSTILLIVF